jgi:uncharacterized SAM-binding protein YcdF (DUF218 family)
MPTQAQPVKMASPSPDQTPLKRKALAKVLWTAIGTVALILSIMRWGGYLLISDDPLPQRVDGAVVLQGSVPGERARVAGAVRLLVQRTIDRVLLSVPKESYWGQAVAPIALADVERRYGSEVARHVEFCEMDGTDSTEEEATALAECIRERQWRSVAVVTSDYHTRRAGIIWRRVLRNNSSFRMFMHAVPDPEFQAAGWWRKRRWAKTWFFEVLKLASSLVGL